MRIRTAWVQFMRDNPERFATPQIKMKTIQEKIERVDLTMARRPKGNYEAYIN